MNNFIRKKNILSSSILIANFFFCLNLFSQTPLKISFQAKINNENLILNKKYSLTNLNDSLEVSNLKIYISNIMLYKKEKKVFELPKKHFLLDFQNSQTLILSNLYFKKETKTRFDKTRFDKIEFDEIRFNVGIDSLTNVSGAFGADLDPINGMYWAWQSGYINFKIEGTCGLCNTRNSRFQYHIGGYSQKQNALQNLSFRTVKKNISVVINLDNFFDKNSLSSCELMTPSQSAVEIAKKFAASFSVE